MAKRRSSFQVCMKKQLKGKSGTGGSWRAKFKAAAKKCAKGAKVRARYTRKYKRKKGKKKYKRKGRKARKSTARRMKRVGTIVCRLK